MFEVEGTGMPPELQGLPKVKLQGSPRVEVDSLQRYELPAKIGSQLRR